MKVCPVCVEIFLDAKHLADHLVSSTTCCRQCLVPICREHSDLEGFSALDKEYDDNSLEVQLHNALDHNKTFSNLNVDFCNLGHLILNPEYAVLCGNEQLLKVKANGYIYNCRNMAAYLQSIQHDIRLNCTERTCPAYGSLIGRHSMERLELMMFLRSKLPHNHLPDIENLKVERFAFYNQPTDSVIIAEHEFFLAFTCLSDYSKVYKCACCTKIVVRSVRQPHTIYSDPKTPHWKRLSQAELSMSVPEYNVTLPNSSWLPFSCNLGFGLTQMREYLEHNSGTYDTLKNLVKKGCESIAAFHKPGKSSSIRPYSMIPSVENIIRYDCRRSRLVRLNEDEGGELKHWTQICEAIDCFNFAKIGTTCCTTHLRTVVEVVVYKVESADSTSFLDEDGLSNADVYYVGKRRFELKNGTQVYVFDDLRDTDISPSNEIGALLGQIKKEDFKPIHRVEFNTVDREEMSFKYGNTLKMYLHLVAVAREVVGKNTIILNWNFSGPFDWDLAEKLLAKNDIRINFDIIDPESCGIVDEKVKFTRTGSRAKCYLYAVNIDDIGYIGYAENCGIAEVHSRVADGISLDNTSWGKHLRSLGTTSFEKDVFAEVQEPFGLSLESLAILTFKLGESRRLIWNRPFPKTPLASLTNVKFQFPNLNVKRVPHMVTFSSKFFQRKLSVHTEGNLDKPLFE